MIRYLGKEEKCRSRELWEKVFSEDSQAFVDYYYEEKVGGNRILVIEEQGKILSMLHRNPYTLTAGKKTWNCDYIVGVATDEGSRRKGFMRQLMLSCLDDMKKERMPFCFLMPAFTELYLPFDFSYIYDKQEWKLNQQGMSRLTRSEYSKENPNTLAMWVNQWLLERYEVYALRDLEYMERLQREVESENGKIELLFEGDSLAGMTADWGVEKPEQRLLYCHEDYREEAKAPKPCIMGRIVDLPEFIQTVRLREEFPQEGLTVILQVQDNLLSENSGTWFWHLDKEASRIEKLAESGEESGNIQVLPKLEIQELTAWLMGYEVPERVRGFDSIILHLQKVFLDEIV